MRAPSEDKKVDLKEVVESALDAEDLTPLVCPSQRRDQTSLVTFPEPKVVKCLALG